MRGHANLKGLHNVKTLFKGKLITLLKKTERLPNGHTAAFEMIKHPGAALIAPLLSKTKIIILRQLRPVVNSYIYELPAGTLDKNEKPLACAKREMIEETGYAAQKITPLGMIYPVPGYSTERIFIFKAEGLYEVERKSEDDEVIEVIVTTRAKIKKLFKAGKIVDAKTICALSMIGWL